MMLPRAARLDLNFQSYWTTAVPCHTERWWYPFLIHIEPTHWWWFLTELAEKTWINYLYLRGNNSDENFNWKLAVCRSGLGQLGGLGRLDGFFNYSFDSK